MKHVIHSMTESKQGLSCVALCSCLSVLYKEIYATKVPSYPAPSRAISDVLMPSLLQWRKLV
jgi:hypothetical protein